MKTKEPTITIGPPASAPFVMPIVGVGDTVVWFPDGDRHAGESMAQIVSVYAGSVDLILQTRDLTLRKWGVHHIDDPIVQRSPDVRRNGAWGLSAQTKKLRELESRLEQLEDRATR